MESPYEVAPESTREQEGQLPGGAPDTRLLQAELIISWVLRGGVLLSAGIILIGVVMFYLTDTSAGERAIPATYPRSLGEVVAGVAHGSPQAVIALGLVVLLATPVLRVVISIVTFALERDWVFVAITALVLCILIVSFFLGSGGA